MHYRQIIKDAWVFTQTNKRLMKWYAFFPALISTIVGVGYLIYQYFAFIKSPIFSDAEHSFLTEIWLLILEFIRYHPGYIFPLTIVAIVVGVIYIFYPTFAQGAMIQIIARKRNNQKVRLIDGIVYGLKSFLQLFEYHLIVRGFSVFAVLTEIAFVMRNLGTKAAELLMPVFGLITIIGIILGLLFTYAELYIIVDREGVFKSMKRSAGLVVTHWQHTVLIFILLVLIGLRIIINMILILVIPILLFSAVGLVASYALGVIGYVIASVVGIIGLLVSGYLGGTLSVFTNAVWTFTFLELTDREELHARASRDEQRVQEVQEKVAFEKRRESTPDEDEEVE